MIGGVSNFRRSVKNHSPQRHRGHRVCFLRSLSVTSVPPWLTFMPMGRPQAQVTLALKRWLCAGFRRGCVIKLSTMKIGVDSVPGHQLVMVPRFGDHARAHYNDLVGIANGAQAVRDGDYGTALHQSLKR